MGQIRHNHGDTIFEEDERWITRFKALSKRYSIFISFLVLTSIITGFLSAVMEISYSYLITRKQKILKFQSLTELKKTVRSLFAFVVTNPFGQYFLWLLYMLVLNLISTTFGVLNSNINGSGVPELKSLLAGKGDWQLLRFVESFLCIFFSIRIFLVSQQWFSNTLD